MGYGGSDPSTDAIFGSPQLARTGVNKNKPTSIAKKAITYSATENTLLLDIQKATDESSVQSTDVNAVSIKNTGRIPAFVMLGYRLWTAAATDGSANYHVNYLLKPNEELYLPTIRGVISDAGVEPLGGSSATDSVPHADIYRDSGADVDTATDGAIASGTTTTTLYLEDGHSKYFRVGDLIRLENEICEVTAVGTGADLANSTLTIIRGTHGSDAATHADDTAVRFPFFNAYHDFDRYSVVQTDSQGRYKSFNFFAQGRADTALMGIVPGSLSLQFYEAGYQELGLSGITANSHSGLTASTAYQFTIAVDGGSAYDLDFTTDSSNLNWGGTNGVIDKIQTVFNTQFYTAGNLFKKKVTISIVGGDIRFTSGSHLSTSAIALGDSSGGDADWWGVGRVPAVASVDAAIGARLAQAVKYDPVTYAETYNQDLFAYDDGNGRIFGKAKGSINYETGAVDFVGPPNAQFVFSVLHTSAFSGKKDATEGAKMNSLQSVYGNIPSQKWQGELEIKTY